MSCSGREYGLQIVAYMHGKLIVDVCAGRTAADAPVTPSTRFMAYSVTKGVCATIIARAIEASKGRVEYTDSISTHWPAFAASGKEHITIADALSHRAGLRACSLCPTLLFWLVLCGRFRECMAKGIEWIAACTPSWRHHPAYARYHPTSWSWIAGGLYAHVSEQQPESEGEESTDEAWDVYMPTRAEWEAEQEALRHGNKCAAEAGSSLPHIREGAAQPSNI